MVVKSWLRVTERMAKDEAVLRKYLLGDVSSEEQESVDLWLMSSEDGYELLEAAEDDLIDDVLAGRLQKQDLDRFNSVFLNAPERQRKFQFSRAFRRVIATAQPVLDASPSPHPASAWQQLRDAFRFQPALAYGICALTVLMLLVTSWSLVQVTELQRQLRSSNDQLAAVGRDRDDLKRQLDESQLTIRTLEAANSAREGTIKTFSPSPAPIQLAANLIPDIRVNLIPGITRSANDIAKVTLTAKSTAAQFSLALLDDNFPTYGVVLANADSREIWTRTKLAASATRDGKAVVFIVPVEILPNGDYSFSLSGIPPSGTPENIGKYYFRAVHQ